MLRKILSVFKSPERPPLRRVLDHCYPVLRLGGEEGRLRPHKAIRDLLECGHTLAPLMRAPGKRRCWKCRRGLKPDVRRSLMRSASSAIHTHS